MLYCEVCNDSEKPDDGEMDRLFGDKLTVSSNDHIGCLIVLGIVLLVILIGLLSGMGD